MLGAVHLFLQRECAFAATDVGGTIVLANDAFCRISGFERGELLGQNHRILKSGVHPSDFYSELWSTITAGKIWKGEVCNRAKNGRLHWLQAIITPVRNERDEITHFFALRLDITDKKAALLRLLEEERMAMVGHVADGVAHDLKSFLTAATLVLGESKTIEPPLRQVLSAALAGMDDLTTKLRDLARVQSLERKRVNVARVFECAGRIAAYRPTTNRTLKVQCDFSALEGACVVANEGELISAILNLVSNAIDALEDVRPALIWIIGSRVAEGARLTVRDNGPGVLPSLLPRLFDPLVSSKGAGRGRGLSMAKRTAEEHHGSLSYEPVEAGGAAFHLTLPLA